MASQRPHAPRELRDAALSLLAALAVFAPDARAESLTPPWAQPTPAQPRAQPAQPVSPAPTPTQPASSEPTPAQPARQQPSAPSPPRVLPPVGLEIGYQFNLQDHGALLFTGERTAAGFSATGAELGLDPAASHAFMGALRWQFAAPLGVIFRGSYGSLVPARAASATLASAMPGAGFAWSARVGLDFMLRAGPVLFSGSALAGASGAAVALGGFSPISTSSCSSRRGCVSGQRQPNASATVFSGEITAGVAWIVRLPSGGALLPGLSGSLLLNPSVNAQLSITVGLWLGRVSGS